MNAINRFMVRSLRARFFRLFGFSERFGDPSQHFKVTVRTEWLPASLPGSYRGSFRLLENRGFESFRTYIGMDTVYGRSRSHDVISDESWLESWHYMNATINHFIKSISRPNCVTLRIQYQQTLPKVTMDPTTPCLWSSSSLKNNSPICFFAIHRMCH